MSVLASMACMSGCEGTTTKATSSHNKRGTAWVLAAVHAAAREPAAAQRTCQAMLAYLL